MKKFLNASIAIMAIVFGMGLATAACASNWLAFLWIIAGILWYVGWVITNFQSESTRELYEEKLKDLRENRDDWMKQAKYYWDMYDEKLAQSLSLAEENVKLIEQLQAAQEEILRLTQVPSEKTESEGVDKTEE